MLRTKPNCRPEAILRAAAAGLALLAAACVAPDGASQSGDTQMPEKEASTEPQAGAAPAANTNGAGGLASGVRTVGSRKPGRYDPEEFVGYRPDTLLPVLGAPDFVRRDGPAQIWQYRAENCVFDLFLYRDGGVSRVDHVELRERGATTESAEACYARMRQTRKPAG